MLNLHHVGLTTSNADRAVKFYCEHFGGKIVKEFQWEPGNAEFNTRLGLPESAGWITLIEFGGARLEIFEFSVPQTRASNSRSEVSDPGFTHICFETDDCYAEYDRLKKAGVEFHAPPLLMPAGGIFAYARDPDGNIIEILQAPPAVSD